jgi:hypothetical protein
LACPHNERLFAELTELKNHLSWIGEYSKATSVECLLSGLQQLTVPIVSGTEADLSGLEPWLLSKVQDLLRGTKLKRQQRGAAFPEPPLKVRKVDYIPGSASWLALISSYYSPPSFSPEELEVTFAETVLKAFDVSFKSPMTQELQALVANGILVRDENDKLALSSIGRNTACTLLSTCPPHLRVQEF